VELIRQENCYFVRWLPDHRTVRAVIRGLAAGWGCGHDVYTKDLRSVNPANWSNTLIVDNIADNFMLQAGNGIAIADFVGDARDTALYDLAPFLIGLATAAKDEGVTAKDYLRDSLLKEVPISALDADHYRYQLERQRRQDREEKKVWAAQGVALKVKATGDCARGYSAAGSDDAYGYLSASSSSSNSSQSSVASDDE
jgi:hypothetical protein